LGQLGRIVGVIYKQDVTTMVAHGPIYLFQHSLIVGSHAGLNVPDTIPLLLEREGHACRIRVPQKEDEVGLNVVLLE
jgi:hypothetical protein